MRTVGRIDRVDWRAGSCCAEKLGSCDVLVMTEVGWIDRWHVAVVVVAAKAYSDRSLHPNSVSTPS